MSLMKAIVKKEAAPGLTLMEVPLPTIGDNDVLIKILKTAICGTDIHIYKWDAWAQRTIPAPMTVGHEFVGEIVEVGRNVKGFSVGDRVGAEGHITCGQCRNCRTGKRHLCADHYNLGVHRTGAFAEYLSMPQDNLFLVPKEIPDEVAPLLDPLGNAVHTALSFDMLGEDVLITGAGPIGIMACAVCRYAGARNVVITDVNDYRLSLAKKLGATRTINITKESVRKVMPTLGIQCGFDVILEMSGSIDAFNGALDLAYHGAKIAVLGILPNGAAVNWDPVIFKSLTIKGIYGREIFGTWYKMSSLLQGGLDITGVITHRLPYTAFEDGFAAMLSGQSGKVIMDWQV